MIKGTLADRDGQPKVVLLGLSYEDMDRLRDGEPIRFNHDEIGLPPLEVFIFAASTESAILAEFRKRGLITEETTVVGEPES